MQAGQDSIEALRVLRDLHDGEVVAGGIGEQGCQLRLASRRIARERKERAARAIIGRIEVDDAREALCLQRARECVFERRIGRAVAVRRDDGDARVLKVCADDGFPLLECRRARGDAAFVHVGTNRDAVDTANCFVREDIIRRDVALGLCVDCVLERAVVLDFRAAVEVDADFLLDGGAHGIVERAALVRALPRGRDQRSLGARRHEQGQRERPGCEI